MARPKKIIQNTGLEEAIKDTAWLQIQQLGAPALSLRGIARQLGIAAPSIYHYYANRDALVTALIVDAFNSLAESQRETLSALPASDYPAQLTALGLAYREWAVTYPQRYQLIFGTPIPGYHAPEDITLPAAAWALSPLLETLQNIHLAGLLRLDRSAPLSLELTAMLAAWSEFAGGVEIEVLYSALVIWSRVHGLVSMEIGGQMPSFITAPSEVFRREVENIRIQYL